MASRYLTPPVPMLALAALLHGPFAMAAVEPTTLANLSLEELSNLEITSASKRGERLSDAPASVYVITADDIRRSGALSLPEALRLAPNLHVAQNNVGAYSISARGFNSLSANKLLVLIDGRSVYTPLFSGVFWDAQDVMLQDIARIEVISGPGGTLWGVNAVNGVINVITKSARDTQGGLIAAGTGNRETDVSARYGGVLGEDAPESGNSSHYRLYAKNFNRQHSRTLDGTESNDAWRMSQAGFRIDWQRPGEQVSLQGNVYKGQRDQPQPGEIVLTGVNFNLGNIPLSGTNLMGRWEHVLDGGSTVTFQGYYDQTVRNVQGIYAQTLDIVDLQVQQSASPLAGHKLVWGGEYRHAADRVTNATASFLFLPAHVKQDWASLFAQDEVTLGDKLRLTLGGRVERNDYTGAEFLPSARLAWKLSPNHLVWGGASRTVRAPSRLDRDVFAFVPLTPPVTVGPDTYTELRLIGGPNARSETAQVFELGYRGQPTANTSYSVTLYRTNYDHLHTQELSVAPPLVFYAFENGMKGSTTGIEMWGTYQASPTWRLRGGYTNLHGSYELKPGSNDADGLANMGKSDPRQSWMLSSSHDLPGQTELDVTVRHVSALYAPDVPSYLALDLRYSWRPHPKWELSVSGQNLLGTHHAEFTNVATRSELGPNVFLNVVSQF